MERDQLRLMWEGLMRQMTAQGASREDIAEFALSTGAVLLGLTRDTLWVPAGGSVVVPISETGLYVRVNAAYTYCAGEAVPQHPLVEGDVEPPPTEDKPAGWPPPC